MFYIFKRFPIKLTNIKKQLLVHLVGTLFFNLFHVLIMVALREVAYLIAGGNYSFGPWFRELLYEYRKDAWGYIVWCGLFNIGLAAFARIKGEASAIASNENDAEQPSSGNSKAPEHFLVKKLDKEFLVKVADIEWLESAGNYVNLHSQGRIYPLRSTLSDLCSRLEPVGFSRIHRSLGVNHNAIDSISYASSGDGEITLKSGKCLNLSRRYKDEFKQKLI